MPYIYKEPVDNSYKNLIKYAIRNSDAFMLVTCDYYKQKEFKKNVLPFIEKLEPYLIKIRHNKIWPGQERLGRKKHNIYLFKIYPELEKLLLEPNGLYKWTYPNYPEDISFFRKGKCWLASIAHEKWSNVYPDSAEEIKELRKLGVEFEQFNDINECENFYEEYEV